MNEIKYSQLKDNLEKINNKLEEYITNTTKLGEVIKQGIEVDNSYPGEKNLNGIIAFADKTISEINNVVLPLVEKKENV